MDKDTELTNKFLRGELSFTDYSIEWYGEEADDGIQDEELNDDEEQDEEQSLINKPADKVTQIRRRTRLTPALLGLMGEANLRFVRGEKEVAEKMCHEIIRQVPRASEPYQTLAQIYENEQEKSLQFSLLAAHLGPSDSDEWLRLANISKQRNNVKQEMLCLTQAIKANPHSLDLHMKRLDVLKSLEDICYPLHTLKLSRVKCYHQIVKSLPPTEGKTIMEYAKQAASLYHGTDEVERAMEVMTVAYEKCPSLFGLEDINLYLELLMENKQYQQCFTVFVANVGVEIEAEIQTLSENGKIEEHTEYQKCKIPNDMPIDLRSKLLICLIHVKAIGLVHSLLHEFLSNDVQNAPDLLIDIEEALSSVGEHNLALKLLEPLIVNDNFNLGAVWLRHAECLYNLGRQDESIKSYMNVIKHAPQHVQARQRLFHILEGKGCIDEALDVLQQDYKLVVSAQMLHEQCLALKKYDRRLKFLEVGEALLSKTYVKFRHPDELKIARLTKTHVELIHNFRTLRGESPHDSDVIQFDDEENFKLSATDEWNLLNELVTIAYEYKKYYIMIRLSFAALMSKSLQPHRIEIEFFCVQSCLLSGDYEIAFPIIKDFVLKYPCNPSWNLLNIAACYGQNFGKFINRLFAKGNSDIKYLFIGSSNVVSGRYLLALKNFLLYHENNKDAFSALMISINVLVMAAQRTMDKHHSLILQGISYLLTYKDIRKWDHESYYNLGRAFQMLNINNLAIEYYKKALSCSSKVVCESHGSVDLIRETAFNLYILYKDHSPQMARLYMQKYLVI